MKYPLVRDLAAWGLPVRLTCGVLGVAAQPRYRWLKDSVCQRDLDYAYLVNELVDLHHDDSEFGYRFLADEVKDRGHVVSETRVHKLCRTHQIGVYADIRRSQVRRVRCTHRLNPPFVAQTSVERFDPAVLPG